MYKRQILISEVFESNGGSAKYVELYNTTSSDIVLDQPSSPWQLNLKLFGSSTIVINLSGTIAANGFFVIGTNDVDTLFGTGTVDQVSSSITHDGDDTYNLIINYPIKNKGGLSNIIDSFAADLNTSERKGGSFFANDVVAHRVASQLPNDGRWRASSPIKNPAKVASPSGFWELTALTASDANATTAATPGAGGGAGGTELPVELESFSIE